jgi:hypothetical protein
MNSWQLRCRMTLVNAPADDEHLVVLLPTSDRKSLSPPTIT